MAIFVNGTEVNVPLERLIAEGKEIIERENIPPLELKPPYKFAVNEEMHAAYIAVGRYDQAHREWVEANEDAHMRQIRNEARENVARWRNQ